MYMDPGIHMETIFGDGSSESQGVMSKIFGAGKRILTGESLFMTAFTHRGSGKAKVGFGAPYPGKILPVHLTDVGGTLLCQKQSFLCAAKGVSIDIALQKKDRRRPLRGRRVHPAETPGGRLRLSPHRRVDPGKNTRSGRNASSGYGLHCGLRIRRVLRYPVRRGH